MDKRQEVTIPCAIPASDPEEEANATAPNFCVATVVTPDTVVPYHNRPNEHGNAAGLQNEPDLPDRSKKNAAVLIVVVTALVAIIVAFAITVSVMITQSNNEISVDATATPKSNAKPAHMDPQNAVFAPQTKVELKKAVAECIRISSTGDCAKGPHGAIRLWDASGITDVSSLFRDEYVQNVLRSHIVQ